ncbi:MAG TPA: L-threonylcarbamoyladenylate synthase [Natronosporangium sp.]
MRFRFLRPNQPSGLLRLADLDWVVERLRAGELAVLPTETGYLLAAVATDPVAVRAAFAAKQRDLANPMHIACASLGMVSRYAELTGPARRLLGGFTPGPLSVVVPQKDTLPRELVTLHGTVGIRIPDHPATLQVVAELGLPVTATSLNRSGEGARDDWSILDTLDWRGQAEVPVVDSPGSVRFGSASTLVRLTGAEVTVIRPGPITVDQIEAALGDVRQQSVGNGA